MTRRGGDAESQKSDWHPRVSVSPCRSYPPTVGYARISLSGVGIINLPIGTGIKFSAIILVMVKILNGRGFQSSLDIVDY
jgi:hypothetical protein